LDGVKVFGSAIDDKVCLLFTERMNLNSAVEAKSARRFDKLKAPSEVEGWRSPLRGAEASTAEFRMNQSHK
jgi:hypothetical protein